MYGVTAQYRLLGPLEVLRDGAPVDVGGPKQRAVLARLLLDAGRVVSTDALVDAVWGENQPPSVLSSLQANISNLRRLLRDEDRATTPIARRAPGYAIDVAAGEVDVAVFGELAEAAQAAADQADWPATVAAAERALALWRGPLLPELADEQWVAVPAAALQERRVACTHALIAGLLGTGRVPAAVRRSGQLFADAPLDERTCWLHMIALYRSGRPAEALAAHRGYAERLADELGLDVGPALRDLQGEILRQNPALLHWPAAAPPGAGARATPAVVEPERADPAAPDRSAAPASDAALLVGRQRELAIVDDVLSGPLGGAGRGWLVLTGVAGIGKSRLADEAARRFEQGGGRVCRAGCPDDDGVPSWWPIRQLLRRLADDPADILAPPDGVEADAARFVAYERVQQALAAAARPQPLLLLVEDVHWADTESLRFLTNLADTASVPGLALVLTVREPVQRPQVARLLSSVARRPEARQLEVPPLSPPEVADLAARISGRALDARAAGQLAQRTGGNPFFVGEYARLPEADRAGGQVPVAVRSVLSRRLATLDPAVLQVLRAAAVLGDTLDIEMLATVTRLDRDELADLLDDAADEHVIVPSRATGAYTFAHALLRDEVTAGLSGPRRQRLHLRAAEALGADAGGERLARRAAHLVAALPLADAAGVFATCRAAALDAEHRSDSDTAALWWRHAVQTLDLLPDAEGIDRDELVIAQVAALARAGRGQTLLDVIDAALVDAVRRGRLDSAGRLAASLLRTCGSWPWAVYGDDPAPLLARLAGLETLAHGNPGAQARILAALAVGSCYDPDGSVPDRLSARAITLAESSEDPDVLADALLGRAMTFSGVAERAKESIALVERLMALPHRLAPMDDVIGHGLLYLATMAEGQPAAAEHVRLATLGSDVLRLPASRVQSRWAQASLVLWQGDDPAQAAALYDRAIEMHRKIELYESGIRDIASMSVAWELDRLDEAADLGSDNEDLRTWVTAVLAAARRDPGAAALVAGEVGKIRPASWTTHGRLTMLAHAVADLELRDLAGGLVDRLTPIAHCLANIGQVGVVGPVGLALARLHLLGGDTDAARECASVALEVCERTGGERSARRCRAFLAELDARAA